MNSNTKQAIVDARWDKKSRRRESVRAILGLGFIVLAVVVGLLVASNIHRF
jgi:hypothetical protein